MPEESSPESRSRGVGTTASPPQGSAPIRPLARLRPPRAGFAGGHREYRRLAPPLAEKDHLPHDILVGQHAPGVLAVPDGGLDRAAESSASELSRKGGSEPLQPDVDSALSACALASIRALRRPSRPPIGRAPNDDVAVSFAHILSEPD